MNRRVNSKFSKLHSSISIDGSYQDLTFLCAGQTLSYHQAMVVPLSPMLESMVQGELCHPSLPINNVTITLDQVSPDTLSVLMDLVYTGKSTVRLPEDSSEIEQLISMLGLEIIFQVEKPKEVIRNTVMKMEQDDVDIKSSEIGNTAKLLNAKGSAPKRNRSKAWNFFSLDADNTVASCNICGKKIKRTTGNTHGMLRHLKTWHGKAFSEQEKVDVPDVTMDDVLDNGEEHESKNQQVKEFQVRTSDLKEFANQKLAEKLEAKTSKKSSKPLEAKSSKNPSKPKAPPTELYPFSHYIWTYYTPLEDGKAKCWTCSRDISRSFTGKNDFMVSHMSHFHPQVYTDYITKRARKSMNTNLTESLIQETSETLNELPNISLELPSTIFQVDTPNVSEEVPTEQILNGEKILPFEQNKRTKQKKTKEKDIKVENNEFEEVFLIGLKTDLDELGDDLRFQSGKKKKSLIWNFFSEVDSEETKDVNAKCNFCCSEIPRPHGTTSKLRGHLKKHKLLFKEFQRLDDLRMQAGSDLDTSQESVLDDCYIMLE